MTIQEAEKKGYMRSKKLGAWYMHCKLTSHLYIGIKDSAKYSYIDADTWNTAYNFSELGRSRLQDIITPYELKKYAGLKKGASWSFGSTWVHFYGFPKEDAPIIADKIIEIWGIEGSKEKHPESLPLKMEGNE